MKKQNRLSNPINHTRADLTRIYFLLVILIQLAGCKKDTIELPSLRISNPMHGEIRSVQVLKSGLWFIGGGDDQIGQIYSSADSGLTWKSCNGAFYSKITDIQDTPSGHLFACDDVVGISKSTDNGDAWQLYADTVWPQTINQWLRSITFINDSTGIICGGKNYKNGVVYRTSNFGNTWSFTEYEHEYRAAASNKSGDVIVCGYGSMLISHDSGNSFHECSIDHKYYTAACSDSSGRLLVCTFDGGVYQSQNHGYSWNRLRSENEDGKLKKFVCMDLSASGKILCAGPDGQIIFSADGTNWTACTVCENNYILSVRWISDTEFLAGCKNGTLYKVKL